MTSTTPPEEDAPELSPEGDDDTPARKLLAPHARVFALAMLASVLLHMSPLLTLLSIDFDMDVDLDTEWMGEFDDLQGVGVGDDGRWAKVMVQPPPEQEQPEDLPQEDPPQEPVEEPPKEEPPREEPPREEPKKEEPKKEEPKKEEPKKEEPKKEEPPREPVALAKNEPKEEEREEPPKEQTSQQKSTSQEVPGLERAGPNKLPTLKNYAPGNARFTALIRMKPLRGTPFEAPVSELLLSVPDFRILLDSTDIDPVKDFDTIFAASSNPQYLQETFLAVRHSRGEQGIKDVLATRFADEVPWTSFKGFPVRASVPPSSTYKDPRQLMIASPDLVLLTRPEWLKTLTDNQAGDSPVRPPSAEPGEPAPDASEFTLVQGLERIEEVADGETLALVSVAGLTARIPGVSIPRFEAARVEIKGIKNPKVTIDVHFADQDRATKFAISCPAMQKKLVDAIPGARFLRLNIYVERLKCSAQGDYVSVQGTYTQAEFLRLMSLARPFIPRPAALRDLPMPPPKPIKPALSADMGDPDMGTADMRASKPAVPGAQEKDMGSATDMPPPAVPKETTPPASTTPPAQGAPGAPAPPSPGEATPPASTTPPARRAPKERDDREDPPAQEPAPSDDGASVGGEGGS